MVSLTHPTHSRAELTHFNDQQNNCHFSRVSWDALTSARTVPRFDSPLRDLREIGTSAESLLNSLRVTRLDRRKSKLPYSAIKTNEDKYFLLLNSFNPKTRQALEAHFKVDLSCIQRSQKTDSENFRFRCGRGSFGAVDLALSTDCKYLCAVKKSAPGKSSNRELQAYLRLQDGYRVPKFYGATLAQKQCSDNPKNKQYLVLDYLPTRLHFPIGQSRRSDLNGKPQLAQQQILKMSSFLRFAKELSRGIANMHKNSVLHGDIKPDNILISKDDLPLLADLGMCRYDPNQCAGGTPDYSPPELAKANYNGFAHDSFSLGITLLELSKNTFRNLPSKDIQVGVFSHSGELRAVKHIPIERESACNNTGSTEESDQIANQLMGRNKRGPLYRFSGIRNTRVQIPECRTINDVIVRLIDTDPNERMSCHEAYKALQAISRKTNEQPNLYLCYFKDII
mgnify:CR=1 FL=1